MSEAKKKNVCLDCIDKGGRLKVPGSGKTTCEICGKHRMCATISIGKFNEVKLNIEACE